MRRLLMAVASIALVTSANLSQCVAEPSIPTDKLIELDTITIEGELFEPDVLFILEEPKIQKHYKEEREQHDFLLDIKDILDVPLEDEIHAGQN